MYYLFQQHHKYILPKTVITAHGVYHPHHRHRSHHHSHHSHEHHEKHESREHEHTEHKHHHKGKGLIHHNHINQSSGVHKKMTPIQFRF